MPRLGFKVAFDIQLRYVRGSNTRSSCCDFKTVLYTVVLRNGLAESTL